jgi:hypothetical protein
VKDNLTYESTILEKRSEKDSGSLGQVNLAAVFIGAGVAGVVF